MGQLQGKLTLRVLSALIGLPLLLGVVWAGGVWFLLLGSALALGASWEYRRLGDAAGASSPLLLSLGVNPGLVLAAFFAPSYFLAVLATVPFLVLTLLLVRRRGHHPMRDYSFALGGVLYLGLPLALAVLLRQGEDGRGWVLLAILVAFAADTSAYVVGRGLGRHPLAPAISRGKTWEGAAGGLIGSIAAAFLLAVLLDLPLTPWLALLLGALLGVVAQVGDLAESMLKRAASLKDASGLIPGHGGLLDRLDSVVFTLVTVYYVALWRSL